MSDIMLWLQFGLVLYKLFSQVMYWQHVLMWACKYGSNVCGLCSSKLGYTKQIP
jgi:hypothetical protein